jgi:hypothetical protein
MNGFAESMTAAFPTVLLWAGGSLVAILLLSKAMKRRRDSLTDVLKKHVTDKVGSVNEPTPADTKPKP